MTPEKPRVAPTERSIPPEMTTKVSATAIKATGAQSSRTLPATPSEKNTGLRVLNNAIMASSTMSRMAC